MYSCHSAMTRFCESPAITANSVEFRAVNYTQLHLCGRCRVRLGDFRLNRNSPSVPRLRHVPWRADYFTHPRTSGRLSQNNCEVGMCSRESLQFET